MDAQEWFESDVMFEVPYTPEDIAVHKRSPRRRLVAALKGETLADAMPGLPEQGESWHVISNGRFDFWSFLPICVDRMGGCRHLYGSTWTINHANVSDLFRLIDEGKAQTVAILTGTYFKRRESAVCNMLITGLMERGHRFIAFNNHAKVALIESDGYALTIEGSANFTANPRLEQYVISNDRPLYEFHRDWMEDVLTYAGQGH